MKRLIINNKYLNPDSSFNDISFNKEEFAEEIKKFVKQYMSVDDFKYRISTDIDEDFNKFRVISKFEFIIYPEDKIDFKSVSDKLENDLKKLFDTYDCDCIKYNNSMYSRTGNDVELSLRFYYNLEQ